MVEELAVVALRLGGCRGGLVSDGSALAIVFAETVSLPGGWPTDTESPARNIARVAFGWLPLADGDLDSG